MFRSNLLTSDSDGGDANPCLFKLAQKHGFEDYVTQQGSVENMNFTLDDALPVLGKPVEGSNNRKQVSF